VLSGPEVAAFTIAIGTFDAICRFTLALGPEQPRAERETQGA
jgi:hypothetical protein